MSDYEPGTDGLPREIVGAWAMEKHHLLAAYVDASRGARRRMGGTPTLVDLFSGPGRVRVREDRVERDGGVTAALRASLHPPGRATPCPFHRVVIADLDESNVQACRTRLLREFESTQVGYCVGPAVETAGQVAASLPRRGIHIAYLDPYALWTLPFSVIEAFSRVPNVDLVIHFAAGDMGRNLQRPDQWPRFDQVAPGWRDVVNLPIGKARRRAQFWDHWKRKVESLGYHVADKAFQVKNTKGREIYRLVAASKHPLGSNIWDRLRSTHPQQTMFG